MFLLPTPLLRCHFGRAVIHSSHFLCAEHAICILKCQPHGKTWTCSLKWLKCHLNCTAITLLLWLEVDMRHSKTSTEPFKNYIFKFKCSGFLTLFNWFRWFIWKESLANCCVRCNLIMKNESKLPLINVYISELTAWVDAYIIRRNRELSASLKRMEDLNYLPHCASIDLLKSH